MNDLVGRILLDQYQVEAFIASGGAGTVFRAWDLKRNTWLAMKVLHEDLAEDPSIFKQFQREARALERLAHPHIVPFYGLFQDEEVYFLLEGYIDGPTLKSLLHQRKGKSFPITETLPLLKVLCSVLGYAHSNGVVHCDVKPGNIILDQAGNIYITDFGIARHAESTTTTLASAGTPAYMAPEQIRGDPVTSATDIYAVGILLFELLTGSRPFPVNNAKLDNTRTTTAERISMEHLYQPPPDPCLLNPELPRALADVILKALEKDPAKRFSSAQELFRTALLAAEISETSVSERMLSIPTDSSHSHVSSAYGQGYYEPKRKKTFWPFLAGGIILSVLFLWGISSTWSLSITPKAGTATAQMEGFVVLPATMDVRSIVPTSVTVNEFTEEPIAQPTVTQAKPMVTRQFTVSPSPTYLPTPAPLSLSLQEDSFCRGGPGTGYDKIWSFSSGIVLKIIGKDGDWLLVQFDDPRTRHKQCWVNSSSGTASGDINSMPFSDYRTAK
jgi:serine/threonine protein kinase